MTYIIKHNKKTFYLLFSWHFAEKILKIFQPSDHNPRLTTKYSTRCRYGHIPSCLSARN